MAGSPAGSLLGDSGFQKRRGLVGRLAWPRAGESGVSEGPAATMPRGVGTAQLCVLVLALQGWTRRGSGDGSPQLQHELIIPQWKTAESPVREKHPLKAELRVMAEGRELILDLEKNEHLFAPAYTETHYTPSGNPRTTTLKSEDHCFYHGTVRKAEESSVTLSTCRGMRGLITVSNNLSYIIEPLPGSEGHHLIYRSEHLKLPLGNCGFQHPKPTAKDWALQFTNQTKKRPRRMKREDLHSMKYVELYLVADYAEFQKNRRDQDATKHKLMEIANYVDKFYRSLNIRIALVGLEVWTHGNMCEVSENPYSTLWSFLSWRRKLLTQKNHDNAQLITGMSFHGTTIGLAPLMAMCSVYQSGGVNMLLAPGTLCREQARQCDLPEFCTGKSPHCPTNFYQMDGTPCEGGQAYCYNGMCLTYQEQCQQLWGPGARPAPDLCFEKVNVAGDTFGNCGKDLNGEHKKCNMRDAKCGKIQCQSSEARPLESNAVPIDTTIIMNGRQIRCRGTHVYRGPEEEGDMLDPGLVMTGTKCGYNHICFEGQCRNTSFFETEGCGKKCNGHGVCNNNQNCHCFRGWAPPFCNTPGQGGSIDSGPMPTEGAGPVVAGVFSAIFVLAVLVLMYHCYKQKNKLGYLKPLALPSTLRQQFSCPFRVSHNSGTGHANPTFKLQTPQGKRKVTNTPETLRKPSQPPPRPPPDYLHGGSPPVPLPAHLSRAARNSPGAGSPVERKESSRRPPPTRPAPPAPKCVLSQDFSRPRPPQKALPANPVPGRKNLPRPGGPSVLQPTASSPQQTQPLPAPALKFPEYRSQRAMGMTSSKI
ncbi:disintegrin and metalloproteinase domain-containing protein 19 isoform X4 [Phacochoerus africanus]|uniref:disintegrin and metalloproteinase domain-containing protein 19 isoform X4 n=1 Tax=Phacochoerus africanus TaxID=41426 RepID=UPI001FD8E44E|nr:disintegrin and metalloproteinase domain-containing protein 19 isoform X4 [Phacochoerus africanus]